MRSIDKIKTLCEPLFPNGSKHSDNIADSYKLELTLTIEDINEDLNRCTSKINDAIKQYKNSSENSFIEYTVSENLFTRDITISLK